MTITEEFNSIKKQTDELDRLINMSPIEWAKEQIYKPRKVLHTVCEQCNPIGNYKCNWCGLKGTEREVDEHDCDNTTPDQYGK